MFLSLPLEHDTAMTRVFSSSNFPYIFRLKSVRRHYDGGSSSIPSSEGSDMSQAPSFPDKQASDCYTPRDGHVLIDTIFRAPSLESEGKINISKRKRSQGFLGFRWPRYLL